MILLIIGGLLLLVTTVFGLFQQLEGHQQPVPAGTAPVRSGQHQPSTVSRSPLVLAPGRQCGDNACGTPAGSTPTKVAVTPVEGLPPAQQRIIPADSGMSNVKAYGARGDGATDDTAAIQRALDDGRSGSTDYYGRPKALYFPAGTYLISNTLHWNGCCVTLQGQGRDITLFRLQDNASGFHDPAVPKAVIQTPAGNMSFRQNIRDLSISTGRNNPGATGIDYISNNDGSIENVSITSEDGTGYSGLEMTRQWPGPCYIKYLAVNGFFYGINVANAEYGPTFEHIVVMHQLKAGIRNKGNILALRMVQSSNIVPAISNEDTGGGVILLDGSLQGGSSTTSAILNAGYLYARNISSTGYLSAITNHGTVIPGMSQGEFLSDHSYGAFAAMTRMLDLPIAETPILADADLTGWARFTPSYYGDTSTLQDTLNSGKSTLYFPFGTYLAGQVTVTVPLTVKRIVGFSSVINTYASGGGITFKVIGTGADPLVIEDFGYGVSVEDASSRPVVIRHGAYGYQDTAGSGDVFLEDTIGSLTLTHPHHIWARQLNSEGSQQTQVTNNGATLWILGMKTEGLATVITTTGGGKTELLGTLIYPAQSFPVDKQQTHAFISIDSQISLIWGGSSYVTNGYYSVLVRETRQSVTRQLLDSAVTTGRILSYSGW